MENLLFIALSALSTAKIMLGESCILAKLVLGKPPRGMLVGFVYYTTDRLTALLKSEETKEQPHKYRSSADSNHNDELVSAAFLFFKLSATRRQVIIYISGAQKYTLLNSINNTYLLQGKTYSSAAFSDSLIVICSRYQPSPFPVAS